MPELPEVETLCRQLTKKISGKRILSAEVYDSKLSGVKNFKQGTVVDVKRQGKTICINLADGNSLSIHLRMTGRLLWQESAVKPTYSRWRMRFKTGNVFLVDPRRFATVRVMKTVQGNIQNDFITGFDEKIFLAMHAGRKVTIKTLLMDPKAVAGIGNIYACEILKGAGISPLRIASALSRQEWKRIFTVARKILKKGIEKRGTSISDWRDLYGRPGENQRELKAYGREKKCCTLCGGTICRIKQGGRSTFYCPGCQK
ncbi:MAG TPA: bifunctional DNA-formamidopyrimidine glycosylase/DNA-(apurinic or apyrimidinic site) lyase [Smithella sp.]|nr:bifunctional DNA-formamidopyrimidine glycosylase/DNA-(apurinic or apyrimidinic site) lyase [Smithella sp.]